MQYPTVRSIRQAGAVVLIATLAVLTCASAAPAAAQLPYRLNDVHGFGSTVIAVGDGGTVLHSSNGGVDWAREVGLQGGTNLYGIAVTGSAAFAVGDLGLILKSIDGGASWVAQTSGTTNTLEDVSALDNIHVAAVGNAGELRITADGGATPWVASITPPAGLTRLRAVSYLNGVDDIWVAGENGVVRTTNTTSVWANQDVVGAPGLDDLERTTVTDVRIVGAAGTLLSGTAAPWTSQAGGVAGGLTEKLNGIGTFGATEAFAVGDGGVVIHTSDSGSSWTRAALANRDLFGAWNPGANMAIVVGAQESIWQTTNGATWVLRRAAPDMPTALQPAADQPVTTTPILSAVYSDSGANIQGSIDFRVCTDSACVNVVRSGASAVVGSDQRGIWQVTPALDPNHTYWWDSQGRGSVGGARSATTPPIAFRTNFFQGSTRAETIRGTAGGDRIWGGRGNDRLFGRGGDDRLYGEVGDDLLSGGDGSDLLNGGAGRDVLRGDAGADTLRGGGSADRLSGGTGSDTLSGGAGGDVLVGGSGSDSLSGGAGRDVIDASESQAYPVRAGSRAKTRKKVRDTVRCGAGNDKVLADSGDRIAKDCEQVTYSARRRKFH